MKSLLAESWIYETIFVNQKLDWWKNSWLSKMVVRIL